MHRGTKGMRLSGVLALSFCCCLIAPSAFAQPQPEATQPEATQPGSPEADPPAAQPPSALPSAPASPQPGATHDELYPLLEAAPGPEGEKQGQESDDGSVLDLSKEQVEAVVITGSRIRQNPQDSPAPILNLTEEDLSRTGLTSVGDMLQHLPVSGGALNTRFNSSGNAGFPADGGGVGAGEAQVDLRYLGSKRTLVLVDGVRWVNGTSASGLSMAADLNTIPVGVIDRIEVLEDGASSIYGSDAIGGVVNIITKKDFEGMAANAYLGGYHQGDGFTQNYDVSFGNRTDELSVMLNLSYMRQDSISSADRTISKTALPGIQTCSGRCSSATPQGRFNFIDPVTGKELDMTLNEGVSDRPRYNIADPGGGGDDFHPFDTADRFDFSPYNLILTPSERVGVFAQLRYAFTSNVALKVKTLFNRRHSTNQAAPEPIFIGPEAGNGNRLDTISIDATNPFNPFPFTLDAKTNPFFLGRRPVEAGPRIFQQTVNTLYLAAGLDGQFQLIKPVFFWDATVVYSVNRADQIKQNGFNSEKLQKALGPLSACLAEPGCVPFNLFGGQGREGTGSITREMLDYVTFIQKDISQQEFWDLSANLSGEIYKLPAGGLGLAAGLEYRKLDGFFEPDAVVAAGDGTDVPASPTSGGYHVTEVYAEIDVPILAKLPAADLLDVSGAMRFSDYSTFGSQETFKVGLRYRPVSGVLLRAHFTQGFRAPGIGELFGSKARFDQTMKDPCSDLLGLSGGAPATQAVLDNCQALGVPGNGSYAQFNDQISVTTGGNPDLRPETSKGYMASMVYTPTDQFNLRGVKQLDFELTYYRIDLDNAIRAIPAQVQLDTCTQQMDPVLCQGITRTATGVIDGFANQLTNIGGLRSTGLDLSISYTSSMTAIGVLRVMSISNYLLEFSERIPSSAGFSTIERTGTEIGDPEIAFPRLKSSLVLAWDLDDWSFSFTTRYTHSVTEPCRGLTDFPGKCSAPNEGDDNLSKNELHPVVYNDLQASWFPARFDSRLTVTLGVNNLFNQEPPYCYSCALNGFDASAYDLSGIFGYLRAGYRM